MDESFSLDSKYKYGTRMQTKFSILYLYKILKIHWGGFPGQGLF